MPPVPELIELRHRLEEIGMVVVEEPDHLNVRLPYFCSVRIYLVDGCLRFEPFFGFIPRTRSTMGKLFVFTSFTAAAFRAGVPYALGVGIIGIMLGIYDVIRTIATENVISRAGIVFTQLRHGERSRPTFSASTATRALESGSMPSSTPPAPATRDELRIRSDR
jgi:hypothetical protein